MALTRLTTALFLLATTAQWISLVSSHSTTSTVLSDIQLAKREEHAKFARRSLANCHRELGRRDGSAHQLGRRKETISRRKAFLDNIRKSRGIPIERPFGRKRDIDAVLSTSHASELTGVTNNTDSSVFFTDSSCVLAPEVTEGPYVVKGEYVRFDVREDQQGVDLYLDIELIDVSTCEPAEDVYIEIWATNSTGVYSGVSAAGNGNSDESTAHLDTTYLRGFQQTNSSGVAQFLTIFPGHYTGRTTHIHLTASSVDTNNGVLHSNGTLTSDSVMHVGQLFFDQDLISDVEALSPYSTNQQPLTVNADDSILAEQSEGIDPVVEYVLIGDTLADGVFAWSSVGIDTDNTRVLSIASTLTEDGGVANSDGGVGGGGGPGGPPSGAPGEAAESISSTGEAAADSTAAANTSDTEENAGAKFQVWSSCAMGIMTAAVSYVVGI